MLTLASEAASYLARGGWIMVPLIAVSLAMWTLIADRWQLLRTLSRQDLKIPEAIAAIRNGGSEVRGTGLRALLVQKFLRQRTGSADLDRDRLHACARGLQPDLKRFLPAIRVLAAVAPLLGLLGTVLGMVKSFTVIKHFGTGNTQALADGISVALVTTQTGLLIAIPGLMAAVLLSRKSQRLARQLEITVAVLDRALLPVEPHDTARKDKS